MRLLRPSPPSGPPRGRPRATVNEGAPGWRRAVLRRGLLFATLLLALAGLAALQAGPGPLAWAAPERGDQPEPGPLAFAWMRLRGAPTVGLQVGHWQAASHPDELAALRVSTGATVDGTDEVDVNLAVAEALAVRLRSAGIRVDLLPATVPPRYRADALLSLHADASADPRRRGYKSSHARRARNGLEPRLRAAIDAAYLSAAPLPHDHANVSGAMLDYYAFAPHRYRHAAHRTTPAVIIEMGYLSHPEDRRWLLSEDGPAEALSEGILAYLTSIRRWHPRLGPEPVAAGAPGGP